MKPKSNFSVLLSEAYFITVYYYGRGLNLVDKVKIFLLQLIASHIIKIHASADAVSADSKVSKEENWLKRYISSENLARHSVRCSFVNIDEMLNCFESRGQVYTIL